jgi:PAS domain S-box-containing protein
MEKHHLTTAGPDVEARLRALLDAIPDLMFRITADGVYVDFVGDEELLANPWEDVVGGRMEDLLPEEVATPLMATIRDALDTGKLQTIGYVLPTIRGDRRQFEARVVPIDDNQVVTIVRDATELRQTERDLRAAHDRLVRARDAERRRLERNLHDGAQQRLIIALQALRVASARLARGGEGAAELVQRAEEQLALAVSEIRELARGLHPSVLADNGLAAAVEQLVPRLDGVLPVELDMPVSRLDPELEACAYYLVAEALANAAKYAGASAATVSVREDIDTLTVEISDNGCGGACLTTGGGLEGLADRVSAFGGTLTIDSPDGRGTKLLAVLPLPRHHS